MMIKGFKLLILSIFIFSSCVRVSDRIEPKVSFHVEENYLKSLASAFPALSEEDLKQEWGKEWIIATSFAHDLDFYRAISTFLRAKILLPKEKKDRERQIDYGILLCYFLSEKYENVIDTFEKSDLSHAGVDFPAFKDLLIMLSDSYQKVDDKKRSRLLLKVLKERDPTTYQSLSLSQALQKDDEKKIHHLLANDLKNNETKEIITSYQTEKKSIKAAQLYNALIPGSGYLYLKQYKTAFTAFLINSLFIFASYEFFHKGYTAAGIITASFEAGWYFGGIYGAGEQAKFYNEQLYEKKISSFMQEKKLFPIFMIEHTF